MRKPTPVTTSSITAVSWSTCAVTAVLKGPATTHGKRSPVQVSPCQTRLKTRHEVTNEAKRAGTAIQCALCPMKRPNRALINVPSSGNSGMSQTSRDMSSGANPQHSKRNGVGVSRLGRAAAVAQAWLHEAEIHERNQIEQQQVAGQQTHARRALVAQQEAEPEVHQHVGDHRHRRVLRPPRDLGQEHAPLHHPQRPPPARAGAEADGNGVKVARWSAARETKPSVAVTRKILPQSARVDTGPCLA